LQWEEVPIRARLVDHTTNGRARRQGAEVARQRGKPPLVRALHDARVEQAGAAAQSASAGAAGPRRDRQPALLRAARTERQGQRARAGKGCGIRWTPDASRVRASDYHGWIREGLALFDALIACDVRVIEGFPTASWTRWQGGRCRQSRSAWTRRVLETLQLEGIPTRTKQDQRDAIAVTARLHTLGMTAPIGDIVVPTERRSAAEVGAPP
jgi:hypothetical protein